jgi:hypothetical protein
LNKQFSDLWIGIKYFYTNDVIYHIELSDVPMEVILDLPLLPFYKPAALAEAVIAHFLAEVGGLQELLEF